MKYSNINFFPLGDKSILTNKKVIEFTKDYDTEEIPVCEETKELICIGNNNKNKVKLQFSVKQNNYRREIRIEPEVTTIGKGKHVNLKYLLNHYVHVT